MADFDPSGFDAFSSTSTQALDPCPNCGRRFNPDALQRHAPICAKTSQKKRKPYDTVKHRLEGTEVQPQGPTRRGPASRAKPTPTTRTTLRETKAAVETAPKKSNWRAQHEDFINAIRSAKAITIAEKTGGPLPPPPPPSINPDYIQCPVCERRFSRTAAERHIEFCKNKAARLPTQKPNATLTAKQAVRTQYKAPRPRTLGQTTSPQGHQSHPVATTHGSGGFSNGSHNSSPDYDSGRSRGGRSIRFQGSGSGDQVDSPPSSGKPLRTGRNAETLSGARELSAKQRNGKYGPSGSPATRSPYSGNSPSSPSSHSNGDLASMKVTGGRRQSSAAKFCHECGTRYPVPHARFCCECGIKRVNVQ